MENKDLLTAKEVAELLNINEKKVYVLAQSGVLPATKITGKWLFPKEELLDYIKLSSLSNISDTSLKNLLEKKIILISGSDDFLLPFIFEKYFKETLNRIFYSNVGSKNGIEDLIYQRAHIAFSHLYDFEKNDFNIPYLKSKKIANECVVVNLFFREVGFVSDSLYENLEEFYENGLKLIQRQPGSGIRILQDEMIKKEGLNPIDLFDERVVNTHLEVGMLVKENKQLFGITTKSVANFFNLNFVKIFDERFDMILLKKFYFNHEIQNFLEFIREKAFKNLPITDGYNFKISGRIVYG
ncbi:helix-turn-helix domain-containing protein [Deferribacter autotrophicus]|uniref:Helix-turn-helix domain-containing protein n=1 Tax=Deferribacter autotrophicus TaxID=500465 RepID=A0A5A8F4H8_9BACT|nr:helix-turn-helix transcriptional regulator [Deferribacter autotrophicus]KAA0258857.1 helix-turn-helix domain-containing protein [Deferribacter autotrophicus]